MDNTPRNFALHFGSLIFLYVSIAMLISLLFGLVNLAYPDDVTDYYYTFMSENDQIRNAFATLVVFFPAYILLTRQFNKIHRTDKTAYTLAGKWIVYLSLLIGVVVLLGDVVLVIQDFLNGELTIRFVWKTVILFGIIGSAVTYYLFDVRGYWDMHERTSQWAGVVATVFVVASMIFALTQIESPKTMRELRTDEIQIQDLQNIQYVIESSAQLSHQVPADLDAVFTNGAIPIAPAGREPYRYTKTSDRTFSICATFVHPSIGSNRDTVAIWNTEMNALSDWSHDTGLVCFDREIHAGANQTMFIK